MTIKLYGAALLLGCSFAFATHASDRIDGNSMQQFTSASTQGVDATEARHREVGVELNRLEGLIVDIMTGEAMAESGEV